MLEGETAAQNRENDARLKAAINGENEILTAARVALEKRMREEDKAYNELRAARKKFENAVTAEVQDPQAIANAKREVDAKSIAYRDLSKVVIEHYATLKTLAQEHLGVVVETSSAEKAVIKRQYDEEQRLIDELERRSDEQTRKDVERKKVRDDMLSGKNLLAEDDCNQR